MRAAGPEEDRVDRVRRGLHADVAEGDVDIVRARRLADDVQDVAAQALGRLEFRSRRRAEPQLEGLDAARREDLAAERHPDRRHDADGDHEVGDDQRGRAPEPADEAARRADCGGARPSRAACGSASRAAMALSQPPDREHGHQRAREEERRDHGEADREREGHEERSRDARHEEGRHEHGDHRQHGEQSRHDHFAARVEHGARGRSFRATGGCECSRSPPSLHRRGCRRPAPGRPAS